MSTIGWTGVGTNNFTQGRITGDPALAPTLESAQQIGSIFVYSAAGTGTATFDFALYEVISGSLSTSGRVFYATGVSFSVPAAAGWVEITSVNDDLSAFSGKNLSAALGNPVGFIAKSGSSGATGSRNNSLTELYNPFNNGGAGIITSEQNSFYIVTEPFTGGVDYTARKGSTATITHTLTAAGLTSATLNGQAVTITSQSGQTASISFTDTITTSDVYDLVLGDGVDTQTLTLQYNVIGLTTNTIQKEGVSIGARSDLEMDVLDEVGSTVLGNLTGLTTDAAGVTGQTIVPAGAVGDAVRVSGYSEAAGIGFAYKTTLGLL